MNHKNIIKLRVVEAFLKDPRLNINQARGSTAQSISDLEGWTALHYACWKGHFEVVAALLDAGIAINLKTRTGMTALAIAEKVLAGELDFMSQSERNSEQLTNQNLRMFLKHDIDKQQLSAQSQTNLQKIIATLKAKGATRDKEAEAAEKPEGTHFAVAACITATFNNKQHVLLVRKKNNFDEPQGMFLFPGGFYDAQQDQGNFAAGAIREVREETGIDLIKASCTRLATYKALDSGTDYEHQFFLFDIGTVKRLPFCVAKSDIGESQWVKLEQIQSTLLHEELAMSIRGIPISHSNTIILSALKQQKIPEEQAIIASQILTTENNPANIGSTLFLAFHLQGAYDVREQLISTFETLAPKVPAGFLQRCFNEMLQILKDDLGEDKAKICVQNLITHMVRTGICNVGDLRVKGIPLIHGACMSHKTPAIVWLLEQGADVNDQFIAGLETASPLSTLIMTNDLNSARVLVERFGANITLGQTTDSALTIACSQTTIPDDFIEYLFEKAGVITDELLGTVLHELIRTRRFALLDTILTRFPLDLNREYYRRQMMPTKVYPILTAINIYSHECIILLAKHGADLTLEHRPDSTLIQFAKSMKRDVESRRLQCIANMPEHPENIAEPGYFNAMKSSLFFDNSTTPEESAQKLLKIEEELIEINKIITHLTSLLPPKPREPQNLEELTEYLRAQWK